LNDLRERGMNAGRSFENRNSTFVERVQVERNGIGSFKSCRLNDLTTTVKRRNKNFDLNAGARLSGAA